MGDAATTATLSALSFSLAGATLGSSDVSVGCARTGAGPDPGAGPDLLAGVEGTLAPSRAGKRTSAGSDFQSFHESVTTGLRCGRPWNTWSKMARLIIFPGRACSSPARTASKRSTISRCASSSLVPAATA